jgi:hypothetical protein
MLRRVLRPRVVLPATAIALALGGAVFVLRSGGQITLNGIVVKGLVGKDQLADLRVRVAARGINPATLRATIDGTSVRLVPDGTDYVIIPPQLNDGEHHLLVAGDGAHTRCRFTVDTTPPALSVSVPASGVHLNQPVTVTGTVESGAQLAADEGTISRSGGTFSIRYARPPTQATVTATDPAGNIARQTVSVPVSYPAQVRAVHLSGYAWAYGPYRQGALKLLSERRINAVQLDIKEEDGIVDTDLDVPLARTVKASTKKYDVTEAIRTLHEAGARVIGRVVAFRDPVLAKWAWQNDHRDWTVQSPGGGPYNSGYGGSQFTNFANPTVQKYNIDLAEAAVRAGFDDIVFDYIRRPDGSLRRMTFPGLSGSAESAIADFCAQAQARLHAAGGYVGAAIFGQAVLRPQDTAQDVPAMARHLDVVVPMDYPNHWSSGSYGVAHPATDTYPIVRRSLEDWVKAVRGTSSVVVPWLWASNALGSFTAQMAAEEIRAARDAGLPGWLMWNAAAHYERWTPAFPPDAPPAR